MPSTLNSLRTLSDPTRARLMSLLQTEELSVAEIQEVLGIDEKGHDYFLQITDARPDTGGLSGATPAEAFNFNSLRICSRMVRATSVAVGNPVLFSETSRYASSRDSGSIRSV